MYESLVSVGIVDLVALPLLLHTRVVSQQHVVRLYTVSGKKGANLFFASNFAKCWLIFNILSHSEA